MKIKIATIFILFSIALQSCENKRQKVNATETITSDTVNNNGYVEMNGEPDEDENNTQEPDIVFPKTGNKASDFLPMLGVYKVQYEAKGDLNKDGLDDIVVVLVHKEVKTAERPMLILLQDQDKSYRLDKVSNLVMPVEYNEYDFQMYNTEDISVEQGILQINLYGAGGPVGNTFSHFKYFGNDLVLTYIETYNAGAGSWQSLYYDLEKGELTQEITNTMKEDMPSTSKTFKLEKEKHLFETTSPDDVIEKAYKKIDSDW